ncbi:MAG TPA: site-2 protease family protein [Candidatus Acidoferrales bacterium]|nr:site-2 protease family protein [Candidatus Acidoferrales bacterium]
MDSDIANGLIQYLMLVSLLTFHEFGHAWMVTKCGDDTARLSGRLSLNPIVHIDPIGTVLLPMLMIFLPGAGRFLIGWAKPVPFNYHNLGNPPRDEVLIAMAGPGMNVILAVLLVAAARGLQFFSSGEASIFCLQAAGLSLILCFFNLIPVPPLDGSHVLRVVTNMSFEAYAQFARFGFIIVIVLLQVRPFRELLTNVTFGTLFLLMRIFGVANGFT